MRIGVVTMTWNDWHQLDAWSSYFNAYKDVLYRHVIVALEPHADYIDAIQNTFAQSHVITIDHNIGTTGAYNLGIRYLLQTDVECIGLIAQDMKIDGSVIINVCQTLIEDPTYGILSPLQLKGGTQEIIEGCGGSLDLRRINVVSGLYSGCKASELSDNLIEVDWPSGGCNFIRADVYRKVGLQDERLFMYGDEVDFAIRAKHLGYRIGVKTRIFFWHEHLNLGYGRTPVVTYLWHRNRLLLKHWHAERIWYIASATKWILTILPKTAILTMRLGLMYGYAAFLGTIHGITNRFGPPPEFLLKDYRRARNKAINIQKPQSCY